MRCERCQKEINTLMGDGDWNDWLKLMNYFEHELTEGEITEVTYEKMTQALMTFKPWPKEDAEAAEINRMENKCANFKRRKESQP